MTLIKRLLAWCITPYWRGQVSIARCNERATHEANRRMRLSSSDFSVQCPSARRPPATPLTVMLTLEPRWLTAHAVTSTTNHN